MFAFAKCFSPMKHQKIAIDNIREELESFENDEYDTKYEDIGRLFQNSSIMMEVWNNFKGTLTVHTLEEGQQKLYSTVSASEFFRISDITKGMSFSYWQNLGGVFTGMGIFGTFLGLVIGLWGVDLSSSDVAVLKDGIGNLLNGISVAFVTSLVGIFFALLYGFIHHEYASNLQKAVDSLALQVEKMYPRHTTEQWLSKSFTESQDQTRVLKNLSQDVAEQLAEALETQFSNGLDELCEKLDNQMRPVFDKLYEAISELNKGGVDAIAGAMSERTGAELKSFADALGGLQQAMQESIRSSAESSERANQLLEATMAKFGKSMAEGTEQVAKQQQEAVDSMANQIKTLTDALNQSSETAMKNINAISQESHEQLKDSINVTRNATSEMLSNMEAISRQQSAIFDESAKNSKARVDETIRMLNEIIDAHNSSINSSYERLNQWTATLNLLLSRFNEYGEALKDCADPLRKATIDLQSTMDEASKQNAQLHESMNIQIRNLEESGKRTESNLRSLIESMHQAEERSENAWEKYHDNFENVSGELKEATDLITRNLANYNIQMNEGMNKQLESFDKSAANVATLLNTTIEELKDVVEDLVKQKR